MIFRRACIKIKSQELSLRQWNQKPQAETRLRLNATCTWTGTKPAATFALQEARKKLIG